VEAVHGLDGIATLWVKRDDLNAPAVGGNKVRSLEFLLAGVAPGDEVLTVGGHGSTHVLATTTHAARLGARTVAVRWPHEMHPVAHRVAREAARRGTRAVEGWTAVDALLRAYLLRRRRAVRYVPLGGSSAVGVLGHVNAGLELAAQVGAGLLPEPAFAVVPLGSGGTAAGLALGFTVARLNTVVVGARVGPRIAVNRRRVLTLAGQTRRLIERLTATPCPAVEDERVQVAQDVYGGAYGRPLAGGGAAAAEFGARCSAVCDATYSEKALVAALALARRATAPVLYWQTVDGRWMAEAETRGPVCCRLPAASSDPA
jgi:D-cysteine desulfhydrase